MTTRRWIFFFISIAIGLGLGLYYTWVISPVEYVNTTPGSLRVDFRADYTLMVAEVYKNDQDIETAARRLALLGSQPPLEITQQALSFARQNGYTSADVALLQNMAAALQIWKPTGATP